MSHVWHLTFRWGKSNQISAPIRNVFWIQLWILSSNVTPRCNWNMSHKCKISVCLSFSREGFILMISPPKVYISMHFEIYFPLEYAAGIIQNKINGFFIKTNIKGNVILDKTCWVLLKNTVSDGKYCIITQLFGQILRRAQNIFVVCPQITLETLSPLHRSRMLEYDPVERFSMQQITQQR